MTFDKRRMLFGGSVGAAVLECMRTLDWHFERYARAINGQNSLWQLWAWWPRRKLPCGQSTIRWRLQACARLQVAGHDRPVQRRTHGIDVLLCNARKQQIVLVQQVIPASAWSLFLPVAELLRGATK